MEASVGEGSLDLVTVDRQRLIEVLFDDREQIPQQPLLERRELGVVYRRLAVDEGHAVHGRALGGQHRGHAVSLGLVLGRLAVRARVTATDGPAQAPTR